MKTKKCPKCESPMWRTAKTCRNCMRQDKENNFNWKGGISKDRMRYKYADMQKHPLQHKARISVRNAIIRGRLKRGICAVCNSTNVDAHHDDYNKPLDVVWLCKKHHREHHKGM